MEIIRTCLYATKCRLLYQRYNNIALYMTYRNMTGFK